MHYGHCVRVCVCVRVSVTYAYCSRIVCGIHAHIIYIYTCIQILLPLCMRHVFIQCIHTRSTLAPFDQLEPQRDPSHNTFVMWAPRHTSRTARSKQWRPYAALHTACSKRWTPRHTFRTSRSKHRKPYGSTRAPCSTRFKCSIRAVEGSCDARS